MTTSTFANLPKLDFPSITTHIQVSGTNILPLQVPTGTTYGQMIPLATALIEWRFPNGFTLAHNDTIIKTDSDGLVTDGDTFLVYSVGVYEPDSVDFILSFVYQGAMVVSTVFSSTITVNSLFQDVTELADGVPFSDDFSMYSERHGPLKLLLYDDLTTLVDWGLNSGDIIHIELPQSQNPLNQQTDRPQTSQPIASAHDVELPNSDDEQITIGEIERLAAIVRGAPSNTDSQDQVNRLAAIVRGDDTQADASQDPYLDSSMATSPSTLPIADSGIASTPLHTPILPLAVPAPAEISSVGDPYALITQPPALNNPELQLMSQWLHSTLGANLAVQQTAIQQWSSGAETRINNNTDRLTSLEQRVEANDRYIQRRDVELVSRQEVNDIVRKQIQEALTGSSSAESKRPRSDSASSVTHSAIGPHSSASSAMASTSPLADSWHLVPGADPWTRSPNSRPTSRPSSSWLPQVPPLPASVAAQAPSDLGNFRMPRGATLSVEQGRTLCTTSAGETFWPDLVHLKGFKENELKQNIENVAATILTKFDAEWSRKDTVKVKAPYSECNRCDLIFQNPSGAAKFLEWFRALPIPSKAINLNGCDIALRAMLNKTESANIKDGRLWDGTNTANAIIPGSPCKPIWGVHKINAFGITIANIPRGALELEGNWLAISNSTDLGPEVARRLRIAVE